MIARRSTPGDPRRQRVHQDRARIGGLAARHVEADRIDRRPALAEGDAEIVLIGDVGRLLALVKRGDTLGRALQGGEQAGIAGLDGGVDTVPGEAQVADLEAVAIEALGELDDRAVPFALDPLQDGPHIGADIDRFLTLGRDQGIEAGVEVGRAVVEADRHGQESDGGMSAKSCRGVTPAGQGSSKSCSVIVTSLTCRRRATSPAKTSVI